MPSRAWIRDHGLSLVLAAIFVLTIVTAALFGWMEFVAEQASHGQPAQLFGDDGYVWTLSEQISQNWQSEFLAVAVLIALGARLIHRESPMSRDGKDEMQARIADIERRVERLAVARKEA